VTGEARARWRLEWPASSERIARAVLKSRPQDFRVQEVLDMTPLQDDSGEHLCICLEKTGDNTEYVARQLARLAGCRPLDVGYCGLKDRHAVTSQWFSVQRPGRQAEDPSLLAVLAQRWPVLQSGRVMRKLRRGEHAGNRFAIVLRDVQGDRAAIETALQRLAQEGAPNYFGSQRFGHGGANLDRAAALDPASLRARRRNRKSGWGQGRARSEQVMYFSAARAWLFNEVLAARVGASNWNRILEGEPCPEPSGPLWGDGGTRATGAQELLERAVVARYPALERLFADTRMEAQRRPLAARPRELGWHWLAGDVLELRFFLPPGQYATTVLSDIFSLEDKSLCRHSGQGDCGANPVIE